MNTVILQKNKRNLSKGENVALFFICSLSVPLFGFLISLLCGAMKKPWPVTPPLMPPSIVFSIVWSMLYLMIGWSLYLIITAEAHTKEEQRTKSICLTLWIVQMVLNFAFPFFMFLLSAYTFSFVWIVLLDAAIAALIVFAFKLRPLAGGILLPYMVWNMFATYLMLYVVIYL
jgi:tryptophan-rich sensory protein